MIGEMSALQRTQEGNPFGSFFLGGFECSTHLNREVGRLDMVAATGHDRQTETDYALCLSVGIRGVREAVRWPICDREGQIDLADTRRLARLGREMGITQLWDLMHYGYPGDLNPLARPEEFVKRFARYARAVAAAILEESAGLCTQYYTPINEISYYAWAAGEVAYMAPFAEGKGSELKRVLAQASIAGTNAIWEVDPEAVMVNVDPLVRLHAPEERPDLQPQADFFNNYLVTEAFDILCGRVNPEFGGTRRHLGILGFNYYQVNQWTVPTPEIAQRTLAADDPRWIPLHEMLAALQARYGGPLMLAETGASGDKRPAWIAYLAGEMSTCLERGVDVAGVCFYPVITSPDWEDPTAFFDGGLFDVSPEADGTLRRHLHPAVAEALCEAQAQLDPTNIPVTPPATKAPTEARCQPHIFQPLRLARFKPDNFSYQVLHAGEQLLVELLCLEAGGLLPAHRHADTEHIWNVLSGKARAEIGPVRSLIQPGDTIFVPANAYHSLTNHHTERCIIQQVSTPKPWDARYSAPHPVDLQ